LASPTPLSQHTGYCRIESEIQRRQREERDRQRREKGSLAILAEKRFELKQCCGSGSGIDAFLTPGSGMGKKSRSGSGMNIPDHITECLETVFWVKNT
jgi:hypothetical protein